MKYLVASDIHGSTTGARLVLDAYERSGADAILLLGDILYHGPRNPVPQDYAPKEVIAMLNPKSDRILAIKGNCDGEVDQMVLDFPVLGTYNSFMIGKRRSYLQSVQSTETEAGRYLPQRSHPHPDRRSK